MINGHGDDLHLFKGKIRHNFSTNIISGVDHSGLMRHLSASTRLLSSYPEPEPLSLEARLARASGVAPEEVIVANGATELIYLIARATGGGRVAIVSPTFREYQDASLMWGARIDFIKEPEMAEDYDAMWLCNPNNPTGRVIEKSRLLASASRHPGTLFIIDQAYSDYTSLPVLSACEAVGAGNIILLKSLTKRYAAPGLRIGYAIGDSRNLQRIRGFRMPWSVGAVGLEGAAYLLDHTDDYPIDANFLHKEALRLSDGLRCLGICVEPTDCNFILCRLPEGMRACELKGWLVENYGILIRDASNFEGLDSRYFRVAAQREDENDLLVKSIKEWMSL